MDASSVAEKLTGSDVEAAGSALIATSQQSKLTSPLLPWYILTLKGPSEQPTPYRHRFPCDAETQRVRFSCESSSIALAPPSIVQLWVQSMSVRKAEPELVSHTSSHVMQRQGRANSSALVELADSEADSGRASTADKFVG